MVAYHPRWISMDRPSASGFGSQPWRKHHGSAFDRCPGALRCAPQSEIDGGGLVNRGQVNMMQEEDRQVPVYASGTQRRRSRSCPRSSPAWRKLNLW